MSTLWTPGGERPVPRPGPAPEPAPAPPSDTGPQPDDEELAAQMAELQQQLAGTPAEVVVANHAYGLFELAALHLSLSPPQLDQAQLAIDALAALLDGLAGRLGPDAEPQLRDGLTNLRLAYVQLRTTAGGT